MTRDLVRIFLTICLSSTATFAQSNSDEPVGQDLNQSIESTSWIAHILRTKKSSLISQLEIPILNLPVVMVHQSQKFRPMVEIALVYQRSDWNLFIQDRIPVTAPDKTGKFKIPIYLNSKVNEMLLVARGPNQQIEKEILYIYAPDAQEFGIVNPWDAVKLSIGSTYLQYHQTRFENFYSWSGLVGIEAHSPEILGSYGYLADAKITALTVTSSQKNYGPQVAQVLLNGIYFFKKSEASPHQFSISAGIKYTTMFSNGASFGFSNLTTPNVGLKLRKIINAKNDYSLDVKFLPMSTSAKLPEYGLEFSLSKSWILENLHRAEVGYYYQEIKYAPVVNDTVQLKLNSIVLSYSL